jgi:hypothetical protein
MRIQIWDDLMKGRSQIPPIIDGNTKRSEKENILLPQGSIEESQQSAEWWKKCRVSHDLGQSNPIPQRAHFALVKRIMEWDNVSGELMAKPASTWH